MTNQLNEEQTKKESQECEEKILQTCEKVGLTYQEVKSLNKVVECMSLSNPIYDSIEALKAIEKLQDSFAYVFNCLQQATEGFKKLFETIEIQESAEIAILEERKKHCKNFLETKQIDRRLNELKFKKGKHK